MVKSALGNIVGDIDGPFGAQRNPCHAPEPFCSGRVPADGRSNSLVHNREGSPGRYRRGTGWSPMGLFLGLIPRPLARSAVSQHALE